MKYMVQPSGRSLRNTSRSGVGAEFEGVGIDGAVVGNSGEG